MKFQPDGLRAGNLPDCRSSIDGFFSLVKRPAAYRYSQLVLYALVVVVAFLLSSVAVAISVNATKDLSCAADRFGDSLNCTAGEFTINPVFSAEPGTPPFCMAGQEFNFVVDLELEGSNTDRQDIGFFVGQNFNDPGATGGMCSVAAFPTTPAPWVSNDSDACGDYTGGATSSNRVNEIKVVCSADEATGSLAIPYLMSYWQNNGLVCTGAASVVPGSKSKCNKGTATVSGVVSVFAGVWVDVTKQTDPDVNSQPFSFTATGPAGTKVIALTNATLTSISASGGTYSPATIAGATNSTTFILRDGETARVFMSGSITTRTLAITESAASGWDPVAAISCSAVHGAPVLSTSNATRTMSVGLNTTDSAASCVITNTRPPTITVTKVSNGDIGTFAFTGNNGWVSQTLTTTTAGVGVTGASQALTKNTATDIIESVTAGFRLASINCTGMGAGGVATVDLAARKVSFDAVAMTSGSDIACTFTNVRQRTLTVSKNLSPLTDQGKFVMSANGSDGSEGGHGAIASATVDVGASVTFSELAGASTSLANYASTWSCNTAPVANGNGTSGSLVMPNANITCSISNVRKSATLTLRKTWANGIAGDTVTVSSSGFGSVATTGVSISAGSNTTTGAPVTVYSGESGTVSESFSVGDISNYSPGLACSGTSGLSGSVLTVDPADTMIVCTYTNTRNSASLTLRKTWVNGITGDIATVSSSGFANAASSGASVSTGSNTTTGTPVTIYAAESGTIAEAISTGIPSNYIPSLACTGTSGLSGSTLTVGGADTAIVCTYTNTRLLPILSLLKLSSLISDPVNGALNPKSIPGAIRTYSLRLTNSGPGMVDAGTVVITDPLPSEVELFVSDLAGAGGGPVIFADGTPSSGLTWTFISLGSSADDVDFSSDNGGSWSYVPAPDANGFDPAVTHIRLRPKGVMNASGGGNPYIDLIFRVRVK